MCPFDHADRLIEVGRRLVCQEAARVLVPPQAAEPGFWFGSGNICRDGDGALLLCGRYRNGGDSRLGLRAGVRGFELAIFRSTDEGETFEHVLSLSKQDVAPAGKEVLSIEGSCLRRTQAGLELYVSSEKRRAYPHALGEFQKPGTGVWSIDVLRAPSVDRLARAKAKPLLRSEEPASLHVKDPVVFELGGPGEAGGDRSFMVYCVHPFSWTSSSAALAEVLPGGSVRRSRGPLLPRGPVWDVAACRVTARLALPRVGVLADGPPVSLYFYDGAECFHDHGAGGRPRGYSCEEIGGLAAGRDREFPQLVRLSVDGPLFVSPHGTGCSRYVSVFGTEHRYLVTWQQSQADGSQPLVINRVPRAEIEAALTG